jgi:hypothetical protein
MSGRLDLYYAASIYIANEHSMNSAVSTPDQAFLIALNIISSGTRMLTFAS